MFLSIDCTRRAGVFAIKRTLPSYRPYTEKKEKKEEPIVNHSFKSNLWVLLGAFYDFLGCLLWFQIYFALIFYINSL